MNVVEKSNLPLSTFLAQKHRSHTLAAGNDSKSSDRSRSWTGRRRRSRSADSFRSKKENSGDAVVIGKKRKTTPSNEVRPISPSGEPVLRHLPQFRKRRDSSSKPGHESVDTHGKHAHIYNTHSYNLDENRTRIPTATPDVALVRKWRGSRLMPPSAHHHTHQHSVTDLDLLMKQALDLKKEVEDAKKTIAAQNQTIESLRKDLAASKKANRKQNSQIEKLKDSGKKSDETLSNVQSNLQCQICLEALLKPYALKPCGHVLCQKCLQEWFRTSPGQAIEHDYDEPIPPLLRRKTCPCCRTRIIYRPIQLFLIKSMASSVFPDATSSPNTASDDLSTDPWAGIFPEEEDLTDEDYMTGEEGSDDMDGEVWSIDMGFSDSEDELGFGRYESASDLESYADLYIRPQWAPPTVDVQQGDYPDASLDELRMMRRGATWEMIHRFRMRLDREHGLVSHTEDGIFYLGWNVELDPHDIDGEEFVAWLEDDIGDRPERWEIEPHDDGMYSAWRLVRVVEDEDNQRHLIFDE